MDLAQTYPDLVGQPLTINGCHVASSNPDRYKQHGFHFTADNCIACHACESACSEKNNLPPHLAFRRVGYLEGGSYPDVLRLNISMACNHCENPVCLKGCPTLAYTKYVEYGAVLQDPDICFGCGYCTWVCPYNAPQLDPIKGQVEKCNMCVDRLEVGLKPACVSACLSNALDFGVIEDIPQGKQQAKLMIPGFPDPGISRPNIRFQQTRSLPGELRRADGEPLAYRRDQPGREHFTVAPNGAPARAEWGLAKLRSREDPLVLFTLLSQAVVGAFAWLVLGPLMGGAGGNALSAAAHPIAVSATLWGLFGLQTLGMVMSTLHLGKPQYFYRAMNNLRHSWVSREIFTMGTFYHALGALAVVTTFPGAVGWLPPAWADGALAALEWVGVVAGCLGLYCMTQCYRIKARPFWDHWHSGAAFASSALMLGGAGIGMIFGVAELAAGRSAAPVLALVAWPLLAGLALQGAALLAHVRYLDRCGAEAAVSRRLMLTTYGKTYGSRWVSWTALTAAAVAMIVAGTGVKPAPTLVAWGVILGLVLAHELVGRALFYAAVVPTTHPGAFFWGNKVFETHARVSGLANMPQVGVVSDGH